MPNRRRQAGAVDRGAHQELAQALAGAIEVGDLAVRQLEAVAFEQAAVDRERRIQQIAAAHDRRSRPRARPPRTAPRTVAWRTSRWKSTSQLNSLIRSMVTSRGRAARSADRYRLSSMMPARCTSSRRCGRATLAADIAAVGTARDPDRVVEIEVEVQPDQPARAGRRQARAPPGSAAPGRRAGGADRTPSATTAPRHGPPTRQCRRD